MGATRAQPAAVVLAGLVLAGSWSATALASRLPALARRPEAQAHEAATACGRAMLTIFLGIANHGDAYLAHLRPPGTPLVASSGATTPQGAARTVAVSSQLQRSLCTSVTSSYVASGFELIFGIAALGGHGGIKSFQKLWAALPPARKKAVEQAILEGKSLSSSSQHIRSVQVLSARVLSRSRSSAKVAITLRVVEGVTGTGGPTSVAGTATSTYLVSRIAGRWYVSALTNLAV
jgi:hypothetical protein